MWVDKIIRAKMGANGEIPDKGSGCRSHRGQCDRSSVAKRRVSGRPRSPEVTFRWYQTRVRRRHGPGSKDDGQGSED